MSCYIRALLFVAMTLTVISCSEQPKEGQQLNSQQRSANEIESVIRQKSVSLPDDRIADQIAQGAQVRSNDPWATSISNAMKPTGEFDVLIKGKYDWDRGFLEVSGAAKVLEDSIVAWDMNGNIDEALSDEISAAPEYSFDKPILFIKGRKNRFVIVRQMVQLPAVRSESGYENSFGIVQQSTRQMQAKNQILINSRRYGTKNPSSEFMHSYLIGADFDKNQSSAEVTFNHRESILGPQSILPRVGQMASKDGVKLEVVYVGDHLNTNQPGYYSGMAGKFDIKFKLSGKRQLMSMKAVPIDERGRTIEWMNGRGEPTFPTKYELENTNWNETPDAVRPRTILFRKLGYLSEANEIVYSCNLNPKFIESLRLTFSAVKFVKLTGIPLDPKPISIER